MKNFSLNAISGECHRSGLNSSASGPHISFDKCRTFVLISKGGEIHPLPVIQMQHVMGRHNSAALLTYRWID